ncbi:MAG: type IV-A pilus assembly ATPase PilB [Candidatus Aminicenantia bacterium]
MALKLGEILLKEKLVNSDQLKEAIEYQKKNGGKLGSAMIKLGFISEEELANVLSKQYGCPHINLTKFEISPEVTKFFPVDMARKYLVMPIHRIGSFLTLAMADPTDLEAVEDIKFTTGLNIQPVVAPESSVRNSIDKYYGTAHEMKVKEVFDKIELADDLGVEVLEEEEEVDLATLARSSEEAPVIQLVNLVVTDAIRKGASDIHFEPYERDLRIRNRIDGVLYEQMSPPFRMKDAVISRIKILSNMDIAEKRLPQDGRIKMKIKKEDGGKKEVDMRVSSLPTIFGEKIVIRILDREQLHLDMTKLGFESKSLDKFKKAISKPWGIILVTGPTGSGKTNTLYSAISTLNTPETNIITAENPVEFNLYGINQVNTKEEIGLDFATCLRSFLRQDPNIILVGEMRDFETADIAIKAALTGHLVFSTVHTNDAPSTITRLVNMGVEPFLVATSTILIVAQRLVRRLCKECKEEAYVPPQALIDIGFSPEDVKKIKAFRPKGCEACNNTGHKGRIGLFEVMEITEEIKELILTGASASEIRSKAIEQGMVTLRGSGLQKIKDGIASIEEVLRETVRY